MHSFIFEIWQRGIIPEGEKERVHDTSRIFVGKGNNYGLITPSYYYAAYFKLVDK